MPVLELGGAEVAESGVAAAGAARLITASDSSVNQTDGTTSCSVRTYSFDPRGNRTTFAQANGSTCGSVTSPAVFNYAYDSFSRQTASAKNGTVGGDPYTYDAWGRQTTVPGSDAADGSGNAASLAYYDDDVIQSISEGSDRTSFSLDPLSRRQAESSASQTVSDDYVNDSDSPAVQGVVQGSTTVVNRLVGDLSGHYSAVVSSQGATTTGTLQLENLAGDIVSSVTVPAQGSASGIGAFGAFAEYGRLLSPSSTDYAWHGSAKREVVAGGLQLMGARVYNDMTGRFTSRDPEPGANEDAYNYPNDPVNVSDLSGERPIPDSTGSDLFARNPSYNGGGIYLIVTGDGHRYVGSSIHVRSRIAQHEWKGRFSKYGGIKSWTILEKLQPDDSRPWRLYREQAWMNKFGKLYGVGGKLAGSLVNIGRAMS